MRIVKLNENNKIIYTRDSKNNKVLYGEIESNLGSIGQIMKEDGTFVDDPIDLQNKLIQEEIKELNNWLDLRRNIEHPEKETKQARLLDLIG